MPTWPGTLPQRPRVEGFQEQVQNTLVRTQMEAGPAKVRRRFTANVVNYSVSWLLTATQLTAFETFFNTTTSGGSLAFDMPHPRTGTTGSFRFDTSQGVPNINAVGNDLYEVTASLELMP